MLDVTVALFLIVLVSPVFVVAMLVTSLANGAGSAFRRELRVSRGRVFYLVKFRTFRGSPRDPHIFERDEANLTWAGRLLKRCYLDELPQLFDVLSGKISLVGPRPWPPMMVAQQVKDGLDYRLHIYAGLTGPAQVTKGVAETDYTADDLAYVEKCRTLGGWALARYDASILVETVRVIARGEGLRF